ncbi:unnamed protein product [Alopecurus aequalis]
MDTSGGGFKHESDITEKSASDGSGCSLRPQHVNLQALSEPFTTAPGCRLTIDQDVKVLEIALAANKTGTLPHVASMNKTDANLQGSCVCIPLKLVRDHFIDEKTTATIRLEAPDKAIYSVGARKLNDERVVIEAEWSGFVASLRIQESDALIFISKASSRLQVLVLDRSGREKTYPCSSSTQGMCDDDDDDDDVHFVDPPPPEVFHMSSSDDDDDNVHFVDPPPPQVFHMSSSDDDDDMPRVRRSSRLQKQATHTCEEIQSSGAKTRKMAPTSSPSANSGCGAPDRRYIISCVTILPFQVEKEVKEKVQEIGSELPIFVRVMTSANVNHPYCFIAICTEYATVACLPDETQPIVLQLEGKAELCDATLSVFKKNRLRWRIYCRNFARENQLKVGDICLFQLMAGSDTGKLMMTVHLIRKT